MTTLYVVKLLNIKVRKTDVDVEEVYFGMGHKNVKNVIFKTAASQLQESCDRLKKLNTNA